MNVDSREPICCPRCGGYAGIREGFDDEQIDFDLANELGLADDEIREAFQTRCGPASRVLYVEEVATCSTCKYEFNFVGAQRLYWDEESESFSGCRSLKPKGQQEAAGQLRLF